MSAELAHVLSRALIRAGVSHYDKADRDAVDLLREIRDQQVMNGAESYARSLFGLLDSGAPAAASTCTVSRQLLVRADSLLSALAHGRGGVLGSDDRDEALTLSTAFRQVTDATDD